MAEKVRYYLEQSVPELQDLQKKGLFEKKEITMIMRRRTDFEHRIQGRGCQGRDYLRYAEFERNLEKLRKKRYSRLNKAGLVDTKPSVSDWAGARRILFIFDRATRRFPGEMDIWGQYLRFAKDNGSVKVVYKVYSRLLQLQPRNVDAWLSASKYEFEVNANAKGARGLFQKALQFNPESFQLWISYAQFELTYVAKLLARRKVLGLVTKKQQADEMESEMKKAAAGAQTNEIRDSDFNNDTIELPDNEEIRDELNHLPEADINVLGNPETNPALKGDVALAIFDSCIPAILKTIPESSSVIDKTDRTFEIAHSFLNLFDKFEDLSRDYMYLHVLTHLQRAHPNDMRTTIIDITLPVRTVSVKSANLAEALSLSVNKFNSYKSKLKQNKEILVDSYTKYLTERFLDSEEKPSERTDALLRTIIQRCKLI